MDKFTKSAGGETLSEEEKMRGLRWAIASHVFNNVFCLFTVFGSVFLLFLTELGLSKHLIGLLLSLFPFCGLIAPFLSGYVEYFGNKRVFMLCFGLRKLVIALLLLLPWIISRYGDKQAVYFLVSLITVFAVLRAVAETAEYPWMKELIPDRVRGKYVAVNTVSAGIAGLLAVFFAGKIIGRAGGIEKYMFLIGVGCIFGIIGVYLMKFVPGGQPRRKQKKPVLSFTEIAEPLKNRNFRYFLAAVGTSLFGATLMVFIPLFLKEKMGVAPGSVVLLDNATIMGSFLLCFLWGWMADRFGGRPVIILNLCIYSCVALGWLTFSRSHPSAVFFATVLYFLSGATLIGRAVGDTRFLYSGILPEEGTVYYTSLFYAWLGLVGGLSPLTAGYVLKRFSGLNVTLGGRIIDAYVIIFAVNMLCQIVAITIYRRVKPDKRIKTRHLLFKMARRAMRW